MAIVAFDGVVLADLSAPCEVLGRARTAAGAPAYEVRVCSLRPTVKTEYARLQVPWRLTALRWADTIVVPGIDDVDRPIPEELLAAIRRASARGVRVASICTGAFVLAATGLLDGLRVTTHWLSAEALRKRHPSLTVDASVLYVDHGHLLTSAGAAAGLDLCLHLVRRDHGAEVAARTARAVVMPLERAGGQAQFIAYEPPTESGTPIGRVVEWIERHLADELSLEVLARRAAMSVRTFCRHFREQVGETPAAWIARARVARAQRLLETTAMPIEGVAQEVGFGSATVLREQFGKVLGTGPRAYRRAFAGDGMGKQQAG